MTEQQRIAYRPDEVPGIFPISRTALFQELKAGRIPSFRVGRARYIPRDGLIAYMQRLVEEQAGTAA